MNSLGVSVTRVNLVYAAKTWGQNNNSIVSVKWERSMWLFQLFGGVWHRLNCGLLEMFLLYFTKDCLPFPSWLRLCREPSQLIVCLSKAFPLCYNDGKYCFSKWLRCIKSEKSLRRDKVEWVKNESKSFGCPETCILPVRWDSHGQAVSDWEKHQGLCRKDS